MHRAETLLVNYWYAHPVGHALEGMRYALGYKAANPELRVSLLLNGATAVELAHLCPFIEEVFPVPFTRFEEVDGDPLKALASVPRSWDWVVENHRVHEESHGTFRGFQAFFRSRAPASSAAPSARRCGAEAARLPAGSAVAARPAH
jgi:hypothetical protein